MGRGAPLLAVQRPTERVGYVFGVLRASLPKNNFSLHAGDAHALLLAGGIGVTAL